MGGEGARTPTFKCGGAEYPNVLQYAFNMPHAPQYNFRATLWGQKFLGYHALTTPGLDG